MQSIPKIFLSVTGGLILALSIGCEGDGADGLSVGGGGSTADSSGGSSGGDSGSEATSSSASDTGGSSQAGGEGGSAKGGESGSTSSEASGGATENSSSSKTGGKGGSATTGGRTSSRAGSTGGRAGSGGSSNGTAGTSGSGGSKPAGTPPDLSKKWFGNIDTRGSIRSDFSKYWDQFSAENAGKWGSVQGSNQNSFNWNSLDRMYKYCQDNNIIFKEHCFIWGAQQPNWVNNSNAETAVKAWMKAFCERYPETKIIDVVNEPLHPKPAYREGIGGSGSSGWDWIVNALKWAREACPNAILVVNDYNTIEYSGENNNIISLVNAVKKAGGPIDAVGAQSHDIAKVSQSTMTNFGQKIIDQTGLPLHITEMDIGIADDKQQETRMREFVTWAWENPKIPGITYWGYIVGATWRANTGILNDSGSMRPAMTWLMKYLGR